jgi:hypothetical protein
MSLNKNVTVPDGGRTPTNPERMRTAQSPRPTRSVLTSHSEGAHGLGPRVEVVPLPGWSVCGESSCEQAVRHNEYPLAADIYEVSASSLSVMAADEVAELLVRGRALLSEIRPELGARLFVNERGVRYDADTSLEERAVLHRASTLARESLGLPVKCWECFIDGRPCTCGDVR